MRKLKLKGLSVSAGRTTKVAVWGKERFGRVRAKRRRAATKRFDGEMIERVDFRAHVGL
jgi:hypothetical protein